MKHKIARAAVVAAIVGTFTLGSGAAFAGSGASPTAKSGKVDGSVQDCLSEKSSDFYCPEDGSGGKDAPEEKAPESGSGGGSIVQKGAYPYEEPGEDGKYRLDEKMCREALKHPEPPHQDGDRWAYWNACKDKYGSSKAPTKKNEPKKHDPDYSNPAPKTRTKAPTVHVTPSFTG